MKTQTFTSGFRSLGLLITVSLFLTSCGSFTQASYYAQDGIYSNPNGVVRTVAATETAVPLVNENPNEFGFKSSKLKSKQFTSIKFKSRNVKRRTFKSKQSSNAKSSNA